MAQSDEEYAQRLLEEYLKVSVAPDVRCELVEDDPPDLICRVGDEKWAVEVTRTNQREIQNGVEKSRPEIDLPLMAFGYKLGERTKNIRRLNYGVHLKGPPPGWNWTKWKKQVQKAVERFVRSECSGRCDFPGGSISAYDQGPDWQIDVGLREDTSVPGGHMTCDIAANIEVMLRHALNDKSKKLASVSGFDKIGLVLINTFFFADDVKEVEKALHTVIIEDTKYKIFDFVFYITNGRSEKIYDKHRIRNLHINRTSEF